MATRSRHWNYCIAWKKSIRCVPNLRVSDNRWNVLSQLFFPSCRTKTVFYNLSPSGWNKGFETVKRRHQPPVHQHILQIQMMKLVDSNSAPLLSTLWCTDNCLQLNMDKATELVISTSNTHHTGLKPTSIQGKTVEQVSSCKDFPLITDNKPVTSIHKLCQQRLHVMSKLRALTVSSSCWYFFSVLFPLLLHRVNHLNKTSNTTPPKSSSVFLRPVSQTWTTEPPHT